MTLARWQSDQDTLLTDLLFTTNLSHREIAKMLDVSELMIKQRIEYLSLKWVRRYKGNVSRGQSAITQLLRTILPGEKVLTEEPLGERLFLDVYCPGYKMGIEYHGRQHFEYVKHFHSNIDGFHASMYRDERKEEICKDLGIALVVFRFNDRLDEDTVVARLIDAIKNTPLPQKENKKGLKGNHFYEQRLERQRSYNREQYRKMRNIRKTNKPRLSI